MPPSSAVFWCTGQISARPMSVVCQTLPGAIHCGSNCSSSASQGMPEATPMTRLYSGVPISGLSMPFLRYIVTQRTMPTSKHSNSGWVPHSPITSRNCWTLDTGLSNTMGGQAQLPSSLIFR
jgi:hypothetical protein